MMKDEEGNKPALNTDLRSVLTFRLAQLQNKLNANATKVLKLHSDISLVEWRLLNMLHMWEGSTLSELVKESDMDKGQISRSLKKLTNRHYVSTKRNETDGRQQHLHLSAKGKAIYLDLLPTIRQRQSQLTKGVNAEDLATFNQVLDQLSNNVKTMACAESDTNQTNHTET